MTEIKEILREYILTTCLPGESPENLGDDVPLQTSGILDSLALIGLVQFVEKRFSAELDVYDTNVERFDTIEDIARTIQRKHSRAAQPDAPRP